MKKIVLVSAVALTACAGSSSGVMPMGPDTFSVSMGVAGVSGGVPGAKKRAITEATNHCSSQGKTLLVDRMEYNEAEVITLSTIDITFKCLDQRDPDLKRPKYDSQADIVIENRRKN